MNFFDRSYKTTLNKLQGICLEPGKEKSEIYAASVQAEFMRLGFMMDTTLFAVMASLDMEEIAVISSRVIEVLKSFVGADVKYEPMYPNFPWQVMEASDTELFVNAFIHYASFGTWKPEYEKDLRDQGFEPVDYKIIRLVSEKEYYGIFTLLLSSKDSLSSGDRRIVEDMLKNEARESLLFPLPIPFKENMCVLAKFLYDRDSNFAPLIATATDVLRVVTHINGGDISLAANTKFASMPRPKRRMLVKILEEVINEEDIRRHKKKWIRLFHNLHVGDYSKKVYMIAQKARNNKPLFSVNAEVQKCIDADDIIGAVELVKRRPGELARKLDQLIRMSSKSDQAAVIDAYRKTCGKVATRVLTQVLGSFRYRYEETRAAFPKGQVQKAILLPPRVDLTDVTNSVQTVIQVTENELRSRFQNLPDLGSVFLDERLKGCPLPTQQRSVSEGANLVARGTRLPIGDKDTLRFFIYWVGQDIDLSATFHDEYFNMVDRVAYTNLRSGGLGNNDYYGVHSGDITSAYNGASEFIDILIPKVLKQKPEVRYVAMNVLVYNGPSFAEHEKCYAGWMTREKPASNEIYDPKTVQTKVDLTSASRNAIPVIFDLKTKEAIWCDLSTPRRTNWRSPNAFRHVWNPFGNNVENNRASIEDTLQVISTVNKLTLYDLFKLHADARATEIVADMESAETVFDIENGFGPRHINEINAEFLY